MQPPGSAVASGLGTFIWEPTANNANQGLFEQPTGRGRFGGPGGVASTGAASMPASAPAPRAIGVLPERMKEYDQVVEKYGLVKVK